MKIIFVLLAILLGSISCTDQRRVKKYGGSTTINVPQGKKLLTASWKEESIWLLYRDRTLDEKISSYTFKESSSWGIIEGTVFIKEQ